MLNTVLELLCTIALTVAIVGVQNYLSTRRRGAGSCQFPLLSLAVLVGSAVIWSLPLSAKLVVPGLLIWGWNCCSGWTAVRSGAGGSWTK